MSATVRSMVPLEPTADKCLNPISAVPHRPWGNVQTHPHGFAHALYGCRVPKESIVESPGRGGSIVRSEYQIDRFRVVFESGGGWHCVCREFVAANACSHTREAAGIRAAQASIKDHVMAGRSRFPQNVWVSRTTTSPVLDT